MILSVCVVVPTFDNPETIARVVRRTLETCAFPVLVVDDGSRLPVGELLPRSERVHVLRHDENQGKGAAIQSAIPWCVARGFTHAITIDGDGQHYPEDIALLAAAVKEDPWALVIGERKMDHSAPGISHFGKNFSNFWVRYQADIEVRDSQSGFRAYPLFFLQNLRFLTRRYDFEIEVLVRLLWQGVPVRHVPVSVHYPPPGERVSHFDKLRDNARISALNTLLVALSLFQRRREPLPAAVAVGCGVLVGCTPLFGLHTAIVILLAVLLRLNGLLLWLGSQISVPPLAPFLALASLFIGSRILHVPLPIPTLHHALQFARDSFFVWLVGSLALGLGLGLAAGAATYFFARRRQGKTARNWSGQSRGGRYGNGFLILVLRRFGLRAGYFCLGFVYPYFYFFAPTARRALEEYWRARRPEMPWLQRQAKILGHLRCFARVLMDKVYRNYLGAHSPFEIRSDGFECVRQALAKGNGILLVGAHAGNADLAATSFEGHGLPVKIHTLQHEAQRHSIDQIAGEKKSGQVGVIYVSEKEPAIYRVHEVLKRGEILGLMADRPLDHNFELVPFLGRLAPVATSPFRIAMATGAELVFVFGFKGTGLRYEFFARSPAPAVSVSAPRAGSPAAPVPTQRDMLARHYAAEYARSLETFLERYPEQWFNLYPFFSRMPTLPNGERCAPRANRFWEELEAAPVVTSPVRRGAPEARL